MTVPLSRVFTGDDLRDAFPGIDRIGAHRLHGFVGYRIVSLDERIDQIKDNRFGTHRNSLEASRSSGTASMNLQHPQTESRQFLLVLIALSKTSDDRCLSALS